jgi:hypothetical protein
MLLRESIFGTFSTEIETSKSLSLCHGYEKKKKLPVTPGHISLKNKDNIDSVSMRCKPLPSNARYIISKDNHLAKADPPLQQMPPNAMEEERSQIIGVSSLYITIRVCRRHGLFLLQLLSVFFILLVYRANDLLDLKIRCVFQVRPGFWTERLDCSDTVIEHA